ncbi:hypothetical protein [Streptomyces ochraceiscleroticus]|uniref:Integral membrane protein n=1 Tax=Streptomyces ochraceiscleroticus TaxID=47761 RepID=A0ABW1MG54_9ACTN|nr:hypothetical protein [Streptomyces ochraceiscleroticus]
MDAAAGAGAETRTSTSGSARTGAETGARGGCGCGDCPDGARTGHRQAVAAFLALREGFAAGCGVPAALAHSAGAARQWISDELAQSARTVAERAAAEGRARRETLWRRTPLVLWGAVAVLLIGQALTAIGAGWTDARTAALAAAVVLAALLTALAWRHRAHGGLLAPVTGADSRLSTSRTVAAAWLLPVVWAVLMFAARLALAPDADERRRLLAGLGLARGAGLLTVVALACAAAAVAARLVSVRLAAGRQQKVPAEFPRAGDLLTDDAGRGSFADAQYVLLNAVAVAFAAVRLGTEPDRLPDLPWGLVALAAVSAATYLAGKYAEGARPVVLSVVRAREIGGLDGPVRTGDDIEIRGSGFVPPGAQPPHRLARTVVRIGDVDVHVPLVPVPGGFANPADGTLVVPVPADVEPGRAEVRVITAAGVESAAYPLFIQE